MSAGRAGLRFLLALLLTLGPAGTALGHAGLIASTPADGAVLYLGVFAGIGGAYFSA